ncbi:MULTISPECIES: carbon starvation CstA family protein [Kocuria]|jgi:carbon starvation protein|uniref:Carbon starvation protein CstA n=1 Tax=Kocuria rosea subsp. polaris TaxID=136273 RepID=A0A0A6VXN9_KOCRO|nr:MULTISPECIES: carbon starvation protein A [Kocuria]MCC5782964.1 carbon starvation protein A [Kocuria sp. CCUG 69068]EYT51394.1 carbon starvation protein CstA [Kocuria sp. UCD-OTCP]KHD99018.1 carbon starvation protein CstA [Kocuria polaris]MCM3484773.1 carbon starvation protein A [Kocuria rosea]NVC22120.1 carbon starvation protein A [Kocuria salina]
MNSIVLAVVGVAMMILGYILYSKFVARRIYQLQDSFVTPAHELSDGVDYVPTNKYVLWGHHFTSVAGAAPIVGPAIAVIWGWVPAFLWVTLGTVFFAGVHDLGALWASNRHRGKSIGSLSGQYIGHRGRNLFLVVIFLVLLMVNAAFAVVISNLLVGTPTSVIPTWGAIVVALLIGQAVYRYKWNLAVVSVVGVVALYALILLGDRFPVVLPETVLGLPANAFWIVVLFVYAGIASVLPVWMLLQPRDYINGLQLFIALGILYGAVLISAPTVVAPAFNTSVPEGTPSIVPLLFVTIACGAISGFHGIVASGTSSKQLDKETDARFVGYFGAVGEGLLALGAIIATTAGFRTLADWEAVYSAFGQGGVAAFVQGGASVVNSGLGIPPSLSATILATMAVLFAATTMDTGIRLQRFVVQEAGHIMGVSIGKVVSTLIVLAVAMGLTFSAGADGSGGMLIWPLFGTSNQLLAGLTLSMIAVILLRKGRPVLPVLVPLVFLLVMSVYALIVQLGQFWAAENWFLLVLDVIILIAALWVIVESVAAMNAARKSPPELDEETVSTSAGENRSL